MAPDKPIVGVTMGDPAGIGSEVIVKAYPEATDEANYVVLGDRDVMEDAVSACESDLELRTVSSVAEVRADSNTLDVLDFDNVDEIARGEIRGEYGQAGLDYVEDAIDLALEGTIDAMCNAPLNKKALELAGSDYAGHTNLLADRTETENYSMLLLQDNIRVTHVSVHVPLEEAIEQVTTENVLETLRVTKEGLEGLGIESPKIAVAGLNPHAGEGGVLGTQDGEEIEPAVEQAQSEGIDAAGPFAPDNIFNQAAVGRFDGVVAMYHDQGHIPMYVHGVLESGGVAGVNMTIGLPIIRTSTMHGTAFDIAGEGIADPDSILEALNTAAQAAVAERSE
ncbi:4-hydroxythreonine-4-phosphate dehydrogenase [Haloprofundus marisrubri]|uniref:4-hydroxythreonine-4-phosphate dehydrogenase n=1 Tax=Haloprofundus marisrubri TaxID=1514971 RepID=A0A0W1RDI5_9EURY|nr:4-hydroxythreonine-4-phosphate dehydrogenase PdxA [Haloprofundus marisrubri]KTG11458.1 4-hydroxythreonine-4-phosphate dehydrogenase [Haloprofundus marisrubri]